MSWVITLPILVPFATAVLAFLARNSRLGGWASLLGSVALLMAASALMSQVWAHGVVAAQIGEWPAPFGITVVADHFAAAMVLMTAILGLAVAVWSLAEIKAPAAGLGYHGLFQTLLGGVCGAFLTGDIFNLYVWFEVLLISSFGLLIIGGSKKAIDAAVKYVALNLISTLLFLGAAGLVYGATGTLNMADLHGAVAAHPDTGLMVVIAMMFMVAFGLKAAVFPLFFWLPASYHTPHYAVSTIFAALLTKVGVYALIRVFTLIFATDMGYTHQILLWVGVATMLTGVLGAAAQNDFRKILSFHIVSQIGYMVAGLGLMTPLALMGALYCIVHNMIAKSNLFMIAGVSERLNGTGALARIGGLYAAAPVLAILFLVCALALVGVPPLSGFWPKYLLVSGAFDAGVWLAGGLALLTGLLTLYSMTKIWDQAFWKPHPEGLEPSLAVLKPGVRALMLGPIVGLAALVLLLGIVPGPFIDYTAIAVDQLLDPAAYVAAVLGGEGH